jgi:hypothetical protein
MVFMALLATGCGHAPQTQVSTQVALSQGLAASDIGSLELTVATNTDTNGKAFNCTTLGTSWIVEDLQAQINFYTLLTPTSTTTTNIPIGTGLVVVLNAFSAANGLGTRIAQACVENVTIKSGQTTSVNLTLAPLP